MKFYDRLTSLTDGTVYLNAKGAIVFSKSACLILDIKEKAHIGFSQDDIDPNKWYVYVTESKGGFPVRPINGNRYQINALDVIKRMTGEEEKTTKRILLNEPLQYDSKTLYPLSSYKQAKEAEPTV